MTQESQETLITVTLDPTEETVFGTVMDQVFRRLHKLEQQMDLVIQYFERAKKRRC